MRICGKWNILTIIVYVIYTYFFNVPEKGFFTKQFSLSNQFVT